MPKKGENIYKRKDGRWEGRYIRTRTADGKAVYGSVYASTYREAKAKLIAAAASNSPVQAEPAHSSQTDYSDQFGSVATQWLEDIRSQVKESTHNKYRNLLESYILPEIGDTLLCSISGETIKSHCDGLLLRGGQGKNGLSAKTVSDVLSVIRSVLRFAVKMGKPISFDVQSIRIKQSAAEMRVLSRSEQSPMPIPVLRPEPRQYRHSRLLIHGDTDRRGVCVAMGRYFSERPDHPCSPDHAKGPE